MAKRETSKKPAPARQRATGSKPTGARPETPAAPETPEAPKTAEVTGSAPDGGPTADDVARRAYEIYQARGGRHGTDLDDWLQAERELSDARRRQAG